MSACTAPAPPLAAQLRFILPPCLRPYPWQVWEDGQAFKDVHARLRALAEQRESIEAARKAAKKRLPLPGQVPPAAAAGGSEAAAPGSMLHPDDWVVQVGQAGGGGGREGGLASLQQFLLGLCCGKCSKVAAAVRSSAAMGGPFDGSLRTRFVLTNEKPTSRQQPGQGQMAAFLHPPARGLRTLFLRPCRRRFTSSGWRR